jgi:pimeloyl-ACP methyl ester carboxylesterase
MLGGNPGERRAYFASPWGQLHARLLGDGTPLILLHQTPWTSLQYLRAMPLLARRGIRAIAPDTPGYGLSHGPETLPALEDYAAGIVSLLDGLGLEKAAILGHHTGAMIAAAFAALHPARVSKLIVHGLPLYTEEESAARLAAPHFDQTPKPDGSHLTDRWAYLEKALGRGDPAVRHLAVMSFFENGSLEWYGHHAAFAYDAKPAVARLSMPVLVMSNTGDTIAHHAERLHQLRPDFTYVSVPGGTTQMMLEQPEVWAAPVIDFLRA